MIGREEEIRDYRPRVAKFAALGLLLFLGLGVRLIYLQWLRGDELFRFSERNHLKMEVRFAPRGQIRDRHGRVIVDNRAAFDVELLPQFYDSNPADDGKLARILKLDAKAWKNRMSFAGKQSPFLPLLLAADVTPDMIAALETDWVGFPGVQIHPSAHRRYAFQEISAQLLGYVSEATAEELKSGGSLGLQPGDALGKMGLERQYDTELRGEDGNGYIEVDARGRRTDSEENLEEGIGYLPGKVPVAGNDLTLTLDIELEAVASHALTSRRAEGAVVALDPKSGEVLALVSTPSFSPEVLSGKRVASDVWSALVQDANHPLRNRAIQDVFPPGSTFKPFLALAALSEGTIAAETTSFCSGGLHFGHRNYHCWKNHGKVDMARAIEVSCDVYFYQLGMQLGVDTIAKYAKLFGLGDRSGIDLPMEQRGLIPSSQWKKKTFREAWQPGETLSVSIGQGFVAVTPLQMAAAYAAIGNGGYLYRPHLLKAMRNPKGLLLRQNVPELVRHLEISAQALQVVRNGLERVVNEPGGSGYRGVRSGKVRIAGKTGTAQVRQFADMSKVDCSRLPKPFRHHGWFVGYAPAENPEIAVAVIVEHGCHGAANPIAKEVIESYFETASPSGKVAMSEGSTHLPEKEW